MCIEMRPAAMAHCRQGPAYSESAISTGIKAFFHIFQETPFCTNTSGYFPLYIYILKHHINPCLELFLYIFCMSVRESVRSASVSCSVLLRPKYFPISLQKVTETTVRVYSMTVALFPSQTGDTHRLLGVSHPHAFVWDTWACFQLRLLEDMLLFEDELTPNPTRI